MMRNGTTFIVVKREQNHLARLLPALAPFEHDTRAEAVMEAKRLAREHPDCEFLVFQAVAKAVYQPVTVTTLAEIDQIPF